MQKFGGKVFLVGCNISTKINFECLLTFAYPYGLLLTKQ